jgi:hypothetical protein
LITLQEDCRSVPVDRGKSRLRQRNAAATAVTISKISLDQAMRLEATINHCLERCMAQHRMATFSLELVAASLNRLARSRALLARPRDRDNGFASFRRPPHA